MIIEVSLFGFGDDRPRPFGNSDRLELTLQESTTVTGALDKSGFKNKEGITTMLNSKLVQPDNWNSTTVTDGDALKILLAIEGG